MAEHFELMIPGAQSSGTKEVTAPFDGAKIATVATADQKALEIALDNAYGLFQDRDGWLKPAERLKIFGKAIHLMHEKADWLAMEAAREGGKPLVDSKAEVARAIDGMKSCMEHLRTQAGEEIPMNLNPASENKLAMTRYEPIGVVAAVSAFNHPLNLIVHQAGPALITGNPVIVKPAGDTPLSCLRFVKILIEAGLPEKWCQVLITQDHQVATNLIQDSRIAFMTFIGSGEVGWKLRSLLPPGAHCAMEHGGVAPVIVTDSADLDHAVPLLLKAGFYHAGQVCVSVQRIFAHETIAIKLAERLAEEAKKLKVGDPTLADTEVGPLIRKAELERVESWVNEAIEEGALLLTGGKRISDSCYESTVLLNPDQKSKVSVDEIFGPVVCVYSYSDIDLAIEQANSLPYSFQAAIFTRDIDEAMKGYTRLKATAVMINDHTAFRVDWMPFGGHQHSGMGTGGIPYSMRDMQVKKMMVLRSKEL